MNNDSIKRGMKTNTLTKAAFLVALSIVLTRVFAILPIPVIRFSLGEVPLIISGILFGPIVGGISGALADLIGVTINTQGAFHPGFTLSSFLWGAIPGLYGIYFKKKEGNPYSAMKIFTIVVTCYIVISLGLNTFWLSNLYNKGVIALLPLRFASAVIHVPIITIIITYLFKYLKKVI